VISGIQGASSLNTDMLLMMRERMFARADQNGDGAIDKAELQQVADEMSARTGLSINVEESFAAMDASGDGLIDSAEFFQPPPPPAERQDQNVRESMFSRADLNGDGVIDKAELQQMADEMSARTGMSIDLEASFAAMDTNGDGQIDETEFPQESPPPMGPPPAEQASSDTPTQQSDLIKSLFSILSASSASQDLSILA
jgi:Ca2+-binding EF-hand superfamily protein